MTLIRAFMLALLMLASVVVTFGQSEQASKSTAPPAPVVTVSISAKGVRFAALGNIGQMRVEVFGSSGDAVYNSAFEAGNVQDWGLEDTLGQRIPDGSYTCVITVRELSGRLSIKQGTVVVQGGQGALKLGDSGQAGALAPEKELALLPDGNATAVTLMAHDGSTGQVVSTKGGLTFRVGDFFAGRDTEQMRLTPEGNLGIGFTRPQARLDVDGVIRTSQGILFPDGTLQTTAAIATGSGQTAEPNPVDGIASGSANQSKASRKEATGKKKIKPELMVNEDLTVNGNIIFTSPFPGSFQRDITVQDNLGGLRFFGAPTLSTSPAAAAIQFWGIASPFQGQMFLDSGAHNSSAVIIRTAVTGGTITERMRVTATGLVGIGTNNPQVKLDVAGDLQVSGNAVVTGNIAAKYQDVAEWVQARRGLAAGTIVSIDLTRINAVTPSARAYDTHIAGVVSAQPGVILGEGGNGKVMIATTGRVRVKVDAARHPIKIGDLLVSSGRSGVAMKSQPIRIGDALIHRPGTIIGKALEPLAKGRGEILVLLSLQ